MQAFTPFVRVATDATRHFATFGLAPAAAFFIPNPCESLSDKPTGVKRIAMIHSKRTAPHSRQSRKESNTFERHSGNQ